MRLLDGTALLRRALCPIPSIIGLPKRKSAGGNFKSRSKIHAAKNPLYFCRICAVRKVQHMLSFDYVPVVFEVVGLCELNHVRPRSHIVRVDVVIKNIRFDPPRGRRANPPLQRVRHLVVSGRFLDPSRITAPH